MYLALVLKYFVLLCLELVLLCFSVTLKYFVFLPLGLIVKFTLKVILYFSILPLDLDLICEFIIILISQRHGSCYDKEALLRYTLRYACREGTSRDSIEPILLRSTKNQNHDIRDDFEAIFRYAKTQDALRTFINNCFVTSSRSQESDLGTCSICMEEFSSTKLVTRMDCSHLYHSVCILKWLENRDTCPNCRRNFS